MPTRFLAVLSLGLTSAVAQEAAREQLDEPAWFVPPATAERWAPDLHSTDGWTFTPSFTPDLRTVAYVRWDDPDYDDPESIQELFLARWNQASSSWGEPERVAATAGWRVDWPHLSPDGRRLLLSFNKPHPGHFRGPDGQRVSDFDLWGADLDAEGSVDWATFQPLLGVDLNRQKTPANARIGYVHNETSPRTDLAGRLYFWTERLDDGGGRRDLYLAEPAAGGGTYTEPVLLPFNTARRESGVAVDPHGRWLIFASEGRGGLGGSDLFVVARAAESWGEPLALGPLVNSSADETNPELSPDGRALFFTTDRAAPGVPTVDAGEGRGPAASVFWIDLESVPAFREATATAVERPGPPLNRPRRGEAARTGHDPRR